MIRVVVADDQAMVRAGFRLLLEGQTGIEVVGEADNGHDAVRLVSTARPDVVLMDIRMPQLDGLAATRAIAQQGSATRVIVLTTFDVDDYVFEALRAGASSFLLKWAPPHPPVAASPTVAAGAGLLDPAVTRRVIEQFARHPSITQAPDLDRLTQREREVLEQVARGLSNAEIAAELVVSEATVKTHVARLLAKLQLRDRVQAVVYAYEHGVITAGS
jgi:DNA-binding NarL/FixJ family response regulator